MNNLFTNVWCKLHLHGLSIAKRKGTKLSRKRTVERGQTKGFSFESREPGEFVTQIVQSCPSDFSVLNYFEFLDIWWIPVMKSKKENDNNKFIFSWLCKHKKICCNTNIPQGCGVKTWIKNTRMEVDPIHN